MMSFIKTCISHVIKLAAFIGLSLFAYYFVVEHSHFFSDPQKAVDIAINALFGDNP